MLAIIYIYICLGFAPVVIWSYSLVPQKVKNLPAVWETQFWSLSWEESLEKEMATHSSILAWRIPWTEEPGGLQSVGSQRVGHAWATNTFTLLVLNFYIALFRSWLFFLFSFKAERKKQLRQEVGGVPSRNVFPFPWSPGKTKRPQEGEGCQSTFDGEFRKPNKCHLS